MDSFKYCWAGTSCTVRVGRTSKLPAQSLVMPGWTQRDWESAQLLASQSSEAARWHVPILVVNNPSNCHWSPSAFCPPRARGSTAPLCTYGERAPCSVPQAAVTWPMHISSPTSVQPQSKHSLLNAALLQSEDSPRPVTFSVPKAIPVLWSLEQLFLHLLCRDGGDQPVWVTQPPQPSPETR